MIHINLFGGISKIPSHSVPSVLSTNTLGYRLGRVKLFQRCSVWVILTNALTAVYYLYTNRIKLSFIYSTRSTNKGRILGIQWMKDSPF